MNSEDQKKEEQQTAEQKDVQQDAAREVKEEKSEAKGPETQIRLSPKRVPDRDPMKKKKRMVPRKRRDFSKRKKTPGMKKSRN